MSTDLTLVKEKPSRNFYNSLQNWTCASAKSKESKTLKSYTQRSQNLGQIGIETSIKREKEASGSRLYWKRKAPNQEEIKKKARKGNRKLAKKKKGMGRSVQILPFMEVEKENCVNMRENVILEMRDFFDMEVAWKLECKFKRF